MSSLTSGYVLKAPRSAPANARRTNGADSGVSRAHADLPGSYGLPGDLVEVAADQYRAAVLMSPVDGTREYLLWAANSSNIAVLEDPSWEVTTGTGSFPRGSLEVTDVETGTVRRDGTNRVVIVDDGGRTIAGFISITIQRGDSTLFAPIAPITATSFESSNPVSGVVTLNAATLMALGGGLSASRGDNIIAVAYYLAAQRFWYTRNDAQTTRFAWDGTTQRWAPIRGGAVQSLGQLLSSGSYTLFPQPTRYTVGQYLPGDPSRMDDFALVRVGRIPDADFGTPARVLVVSEEDAADPAYVFPADTDAVVGVTSGLLVWNPTFVSDNAGGLVWYAPETFSDGSTGVIGPLLAAGDGRTPRFIAPIPDRGEYPLIRVGSRHYLQAVGVDDDAVLASLSVGDGEVGYSRTTGRLKLSADLVAKADPDDARFDKLFLGATIYYDGVTLTERPLSVREPVELAGNPVDNNNDLFIPLAGFSGSGVEIVPDETGTRPNSTVDPQTRPNGSGLVRKLRSSPGGDRILFSKSVAIEKIDVVEFEDELPAFDFLVSRGTAKVALQADTTGATSGSKIALSNRDRRAMAGEVLYFVQADVTPASWTSGAVLGSQLREPFVLTGDEVLAVSVDGVASLWSASALGAGSWSAADVAASLQATVGSGGSVTSYRGRVWISSNDPSNTGSQVAIGFGTISSGAFVDRDLSGCAALGFLPGWRATGDGAYLPDAGLSFGVRRSSVNLDRTAGVADFRSTYRVQNSVVAKSVQPISMFNLTNPPLEDVAGYDDGVFFTLRDDAFVRYLRPYEELVYRFDTNRVLWCEPGSVNGSIGNYADTLPLGQSGVFGETMHPALDGGLYLSRDGGVRTLLERNTDYLLPGNGSQGIAPLVEVLGGLITTGARGSVTGTTFADPMASFISDGVVAGDLIKITNGDVSLRGVYRVLTVASATTLMLDRPAPMSGVSLTWDVYRGADYSTFDRSLLVGPGEVLVGFDPLGAEVFVAKILTPLGTLTSTTLQADVGITRTLGVRFGSSVGSPQASVAALKLSRLGMVGGVVSSVADADDDAHWINGDFEIVVGDKAYRVGDSNLIGVSSFTTGLTGDVIEYGLAGSLVSGQIRLGAGVSATRAGAFVYYRQTFLSTLAAGEAEYDRVSGSIQISVADAASYAGQEAYLVETLEAQTDAILGPVQGTVLLNRPQRSGQILEVQYRRAVPGSGALYIDPATNAPVDVVEQLPLFVRTELATRVDGYTYTFNPTGRTRRTDIDVAVWAGSRLMTTGNRPRVTVTENTIKFLDEVLPATQVRVNYAVVQAFGGEQSFTVSSPPVWRPPLIIPAGGTTLTATGDRTAEVQVGAVMAVGPVVYYVTDVSYADGQSTITVFPASPQEAGTRDPGAASPAMVTSGSVDHDGFWVPITAGYTPVDRGQLSIRLNGDQTEFARVNHLIEVGGVPSLIAASVLAPGGVFTDVRITSPFQRGFDPTVDAVRLSARPLYVAGTRDTEGGGALIGRPYATYELIRFTGSAVGRVLVEGEDYTVDTGTGAVTLLEAQAGVQVDDTFVLRQTRSTGVRPRQIAGMTILPTYSASYVYETTPSRDNGYLGGTLTARYTFRAPDTFYCRTVAMAEWMGEVQEDAVAAVASTNPHGGPVLTVSPPSENKDFGTSPLNTQRRQLRDKDWAARRFISLYDDLIVAFEQVLEAVDGRVIGDRDGKFRFFVGMGRTYAPPGWEDEITGSLVPRNLWASVFESVNHDFTVVEADPLVEPTTAVIDPITLEVTGDMMDPDRLEGLLSQQVSLILNDMDDMIVEGSDGVRLHRDPGDLLPRFDAIPGYRGLWEPSRFSRLFPEEAMSFGTTYPGIGYDAAVGDPGVYAFRKTVPPVGDQVLPRQASTFFKEILPVENPAFGRFKNVEGAQVRKRLARGRVVAYSPTGFPTLDLSFIVNPRPAVIISQVELSAFPVSPGSGLPDLARLSAAGGPVPDLTTGDAQLSTPPWPTLSVVGNVLPQIGFGTPDGTVYQVGYAGSIETSLFGPDTPEYSAVFVGEVLAGCIVTFAWVSEGSGTTITDPGGLALIGAGEPGSTTPFVPQVGDTVFVIAATSGADIGTADPPSLEDAERGVSNSPLYRTGFDIGLANRSGKFRDVSLPTFLLPLQQLTGQNPVEPITCVEADIEFTNNRVRPFIFPALTGGRTNDNGDYSIPYLSAPNTELTRLAVAQGVFSSIVETDGSNWALYPDEVLGTDGAIFDGVLATARDFTPVTTAGSYTPHSGIGDTRQFDLLMVEVGQAGVSNAGSTGVLHVGAVSTHGVIPPRFVSPTRAGDMVGYALTNAMVSANADGLSGMDVYEDAGTTVLDITSVGGLFFNDGSGTVAGGLNEIFNPSLNPFPNGNKVTIEILDPATGVVLETVEIEGGVASGGAGGALITSTVTADNKTLVIPATGFVDFGVLGGSAPGPVGPFDFRLSIDTFNLTGPGSKGSYSAEIWSDRLTFSEALDLRTAPVRGTVHPNNPATSLQAELSVWAVTASGNASLVNSPLYVNGAPLTFLSPGTFGGGQGTLTAVGFEGNGNVPITGSDVVFSAMPSSESVLDGTGAVADDSNAVVGITELSGAVSNVEAGDVLVIQRSAVGDAAVTSGTYVVSHAVPDGGSGYQEVAASATVGGAGWAQAPTYSVVSSNLSALLLTTNAPQTVSYSDSGYDWEAAGRVYLFPQGVQLSAVRSMRYSSFAVIGENMVFSLVTGTGRDSTGASLTDAEFFEVADPGTTVSGATYVPVGQLAANLPVGNTVADETGTTHGFVTVTFKNLISGGQAFLAVSDANSIGGYPATPPSTGTLAVLASDNGSFPPTPANEFRSAQTDPMFVGVPLFLDLRGLFDVASGWASLVHGVHDAVRCLAPGDALYSYNTLMPSGTGFRAKAGIFVEPSSPRASRDYGDGNPKVVDATHSGVLGTLDLGMPNPSDFFVTSPEQVRFEVRRVRRWHQVLDGIGDSLVPLKYAYEIRQGVVASYDDSTRALVSVSGTQLGPFTSRDVNVNPGDLVRLLDSGSVVDVAEVAAVIDGTTLKLRRPGFQEFVPMAGMVFQVYLRQAPAPHLQSNEQLLDLLTETVVLSRTADPTSPTDGGYVDEFNKMRDGGVIDFTAAGVVEGDYLVVDPAGVLRGPTGTANPVEYGARPEGDISVPGRAPFIAGAPSELDDNRGFYKVVGVGAELEVSEVCDFAGSASSPVIFGSTGQEFVVLPTVSASAMPDAPDAPNEPQQGLRPTRPAGTFSSDPNSYAGGPYSIAPFSYRVIRPVGTVSSETVELALFIRERMLSWVGEIRYAYDATKQGSYYVFQRDEHVSDLGSPASAQDGLGVPSNVYCQSLSGLTGVAPFANTSDCLSILDRRYWCLDYRLDYETPPYGSEPYSSFAVDNSSGGSYTVGSGRPVMVDRIDDVLDRGDNLRGLRASWIRYRADRVSGTLPAMARLSSDEATAERAAEDLANLKKG